MKNNAAKLLTGVFIVIFSLIFTLPTLAYDPDERGNSTTQTQDDKSQDQQMPTASDECRYFLGMVSWDCNTKLTNNSSVDESTLKSGIWIIAANVATNITVIAAYLVIGYVIYGGYLYTFSGGDPGKVATGRKTLAQAFIGLAIVLLAHIIINSIRIALGANFTANCTAAGECYNTDSAGNMIIGLINWVIGIAGVVSVVFVIYGGISYITSTGDPNKVQKAKQMITYALIGLAIVALATTITAFVSNAIRQANQDALVNNTLISKEAHEINYH